MRRKPYNESIGPVNEKGKMHQTFCGTLNNSVTKVHVVKLENSYIATVSTDIFKYLSSSHPSLLSNFLLTMLVEKWSYDTFFDLSTNSVCGGNKVQ